MKHFAFTKLVVADLDASATFYTNVFGLQEQRRVKDDIGGGGVGGSLFESTAPGGATFVLLHVADTPAPATGAVLAGFVTDEIDDVFTRAAAAGAAGADPGHARPHPG